MGMFSINRKPDGDPNATIQMTLKDAANDTTIRISLDGSSELVSSMFAEMCQGDVFSRILRDCLRFTTKAEVVAEMRRAGISEETIENFENGGYWPDLIGD